MDTSVIADKRLQAGWMERTLSPWALHLTALAIIIATMGALLFPDIKAAVEVWWIYPAYSHCFLIIPISAWLIWEQRSSLYADSPASAPWALLGAMPMLLLWFIGEFASITEFRQFASVGLAEVFIVAILGWHIFRKISFACLYLFFLVPTGQYLIPPLQDITAKFVESGLNIFGIPYFRDGLVFQLINGSYEIAEACAGLRFLVATVALGVLFSHLVYRKKAKIILFLVACCVLPVIGNGIRALLTVMVANYTSNKIAAGFDHVVYGWVFAVSIIFILLLVGSRFTDPEAMAQTPKGPALVRSTRYFRLFGTLLAALVILAIAPTLGYSGSHRPTPIDPVALGRRITIHGWHRSDGNNDWRIDFSSADAQFASPFVRDDGQPGATVDVNINYYVRDRRSPSLLAASNHAWQQVWNPIEQHRIRQQLGGMDVPFEETIIGAGDFKRLVWATYWVDGRFTTSALILRLLEFQSGISRGHSAVVALSTPIRTSARDARQSLGTLAASFENLSAGLSQVGSSTASKR